MIDILISQVDEHNESNILATKELNPEIIYFIKDKSCNNKADTLKKYYERNFKNIKLNFFDIKEGDNTALEKLIKNPKSKNSNFDLNTIFLINDWHEYYVTIQNTIGIFAFFLFISLFIRMARYKKEVNDEMEITNLRKCDSICFKITTALIVGIGFLSAILRFKISSEIIGYMLMGGLILNSIIRVILFCIIDKKGC